MYTRRWPCLVIIYVLLRVTDAQGQTFELADPRALGMGDAYVAVASDSSATWWNPAGLAAGPFIDLSISRNHGQAGGDDPRAWRGNLTSFALGTPPAGVSYYRFRITDVTAQGSTATADGDRQSTRTGVAIRSIPASQLGVTLVQSLISGIHVGSTLKYVRGEVRSATGAGRNDDLLDAGDALSGTGGSDGAFDLDVGILGVFGPIRAGGVVRNLRHASVGGAGGV